MDEAAESSALFTPHCLMGLSHCADRLSLESAKPLQELLQHLEQCDASGAPTNPHPYGLLGRIKRGIFNYGCSDHCLRPFTLPEPLASDQNYDVTVRATKYTVRTSCVLLRHNGTKGLDAVPYTMIHSLHVLREDFGLAVRFDLGKHHECRECGAEQGIQRTQCFKKDCKANLPVPAWTIKFGDEASLRCFIADLNTRVIAATGECIGSINFQSNCPAHLLDISIDHESECPREFSLVGSLTNFVQQFNAVLKIAMKTMQHNEDLSSQAWESSRLAKNLPHVVSRYGGPVLSMVLQDIDGEVYNKSLFVISQLVALSVPSHPECEDDPNKPNQVGGPSTPALSSNKTAGGTSPKSRTNFKTARSPLHGSPGAPKDPAKQHTSPKSTAPVGLSDEASGGIDTAYKMRKHLVEPAPNINNQPSLNPPAPKSLSPTNTWSKSTKPTSSSKSVPYQYSRVHVKGHEKQMDAPYGYDKFHVKTIGKWRVCTRGEVGSPNVEIDD